MILSGDFCKKLKKLNDEDIVIFLNSKNDFCFYHPLHKNIWKNIEIIDLVKKITSREQYNKRLFVKNTIFERIQDEKIYVYSKKGFEMSKKITKELPTVGIVIETVKHDENQHRTKVLEGMLKATEQRLMQYINSESVEVEK